MQSLEYIREFDKSDNNYEIHHVSKKIMMLEKDEARFQEVFDSMVRADMIYWVYPVYSSFVPYQLLRFIEMVYQHPELDKLKGKYSSQIVTSMNFYDYIPNIYMRQVCEDWGMNVIPGHFANMTDMVFKHGQNSLDVFAKEIQYHVESNFKSVRDYAPTVYESKTYIPEEITACDHNSNYKISLITNNLDPESNLGKMIDVFIKMTPNPVTVLNLHELDIKTGCLGCLHCTMQEGCSIKDDHRKIFDEHIWGSDCVIYAVEIENHAPKSIWKKFEDRHFSNGHRVSVDVKPVGFLFSGPISQESNLREMYEARGDVGHSFQLDSVSDEGDSELITESIKTLSKKMMWALENKASRPQTFWGIAGIKIFRDMIYTMKGLMRDDHKYYKKNKLYDFPQNKKGMIIFSYILGSFMSIKRIKKKILPKLSSSRIKIYQRVIGMKKSSQLKGRELEIGM